MAGSLLFILVGPSGVGKTTLLKQALADIPDLRKYVTSTTRPARPDEVEGKDYHFLTRAVFERMLAEGKMVESQEFYGNLYGSTYDNIEEAINGEVDRITSTEVMGAEALQERYPGNVVTIFVSPPSLAALRGRRAGRAEETAAQEALREQRTMMEMERAGRFRYALINKELNGAILNIESIIRAERCARFARQIKQKGLLRLL